MQRIFLMARTRTPLNVFLNNDRPVGRLRKEAAGGCDNAIQLIDSFLS